MPPEIASHGPACAIRNVGQRVPSRISALYTFSISEARILENVPLAVGTLVDMRIQLVLLDPNRHPPTHTSPQ